MKIDIPVTRGRYSRRARGHSARALRSLLTGHESIGFDGKLALAAVFGIIAPRTRKRLQVLNTLRNKCSHNWQLKVTVRRGKRPAQKKPPLLPYEGRDLHTVAVLKDFMGEFVGIYLKLFLKT